MQSNILLKRGLTNKFNTIKLKAGEPAFLTDTGKLYIGDGTKNILINPLDKPISLDTTKFYPKVKTNEYGQIIAQSTLLVDDIPLLPNTKITGLGTASILNTGTTAGNIPLLDSSGKLPNSVIPNPSNTASYAMATYAGNDGRQVTPGAYAPLSELITSNTSHFSIDTNGVITVNLQGVYLISYSISSASSSISTSLGNGATINYPGSMARSSATAVPSYVNVSASIIRNITTIPAKFGIRNNGSTNFPMLAVHGVLTITKID